MRWLSYVLFFTMIVMVDAAVHWYLFLRLVRDPGWSPQAKTIGGWAILALAVGLPLILIFSRSLPQTLAQPIAGAAYIWMGVAFYLVVPLLVFDLLRWLATGALGLWALMSDGATEVDSERREVLAKVTAAAAGVAAVGFSGAALRSGLADVEVKEVGVDLERLPKALSGLSIIQLTDMHIGETNLGRRFVETVVDKSNAEKPDLVVITGDLVDGGVAELRELVEPIANLKARYGVYFVTGNHEYYSGVQVWEREIARLGIRVLRNERVEIGDPEASIDLAGVDDYNASRFGNGHGSNIARAIDGRDPERELVLLAHQPKSIADAVVAGAGLQVSGHTHGGQLWPFSAVVSLTQPYMRGLYRHDDRTQIYVSIGTGHWGPPMRFLAPAEITKIVLS